MTFIIQSLTSFLHFYVTHFSQKINLRIPGHCCLFSTYRVWLGQAQISLFAVAPELPEITVKEGKKERRKIKCTHHPYWPFCFLPQNTFWVLIFLFSTLKLHFREYLTESGDSGASSEFY